MSRSVDTTPDHQTAHPGHADPTNVGSAGTSMVLGILGAVAGALALGRILPLVLGIIGLVLEVAGLVAGISSYITAKDLPRGNTGAAIGGILLSSFALVLSAVPVTDLSLQFQDLSDAVEQLEREGSQTGDGQLTD